MKTSYSQTSTREAVRSVSFSEENSFTDTHSVESDPDRTIVYGLWQLVDVFVITDRNKQPILSDALVHVEIPETAAQSRANLRASEYRSRHVNHVTSHHGPTIPIDG